jgi:hypothetical protein
MVARWALVPVDGSAAWSDLALADAWFGKGISDADAALANPPAGFAAQYAAVRAAAEAASNAYRAANVAPPADPDYGGLLDYWYGGVTNLETDDATHQRMGRLVARSAGHVVHRGEAKRRIVEFWRALGKGALGTSADPLCDVAVRVALGERAQVLEFCVGAGPAGDGLCAFDGLFMGCAEYRDGAGPFNEGCAPPTWDTLRWHDPPRVGIGAGDNCRVAKCLPPLRWSLEFLAAVLRRGATRGAAGVLRDAWLFSVARNAATLRRYNLLPAELVDAAAHIPADVTAATWADPATKTACSRSPRRPRRPSTPSRAPSSASPRPSRRSGRAPSASRPTRSGARCPSTSSRPSTRSTRTTRPTRRPTRTCPTRRSSCAARPAACCSPGSSASRSPGPAPARRRSRRRTTPRRRRRAARRAR